MKSFNNILSLIAGASALALPTEIEKRADQRFDSNVRSDLKFFLTMTTN